MLRLHFVLAAAATAVAAVFLNEISSGDDNRTRRGRADERSEAESRTKHRISWWPLLIVAIGGVATAIWALVLGWLALRLLW